MGLLTKLSKRKRIAVYLVAALSFATVVKILWEHFQAKFPWWPHNWDAGEVLAVIAIAFAVVQFLDARQEEHALDQQELRLTSMTSGMADQSARLVSITEQMSHQAAEMQAIALSMSTRFAGAFPDNLATIISVINNAKHSLKIIVDFPGYGQYSAPEHHRDYLNAIESARKRRVDVQLICYTEALAAKERLQQFPDDGFATKNAEKFENFFRFRRTPPVTAFAELRQILTDQDQNTRRRLQDDGVLPKYHHEPAAFFLWLIDEHAEAVFAFKNLGQRDVALSFRTQDGNLVRTLCDIFARRWDKAKDDYHWTEPANAQVDARTSLPAPAPSVTSNTKPPEDTIH